MDRIFIYYYLHNMKVFHLNNISISHYQNSMRLCIQASKLNYYSNICNYQYQTIKIYAKLLDKVVLCLHLTFSPLFPGYLTS